MVSKRPNVQAQKCRLTDCGALESQRLHRDTNCTAPNSQYSEDHMQTESAKSSHAGEPSCQKRTPVSYPLQRAVRVSPARNIDHPSVEGRTILRISNVEYSGLGQHRSIHEPT